MTFLTKNISKTNVRNFIFLLIALFAILIAINFKLVRYGLLQAKGQLSIIAGAIPINDALNSDQIPDSLKIKIRLIDDVRGYAIDKLGLVDSKNYTTYYDQKGKILLWNLSASKPYRLEPYLWKFPILGSFPYKGFFDLKEAKKEQKKLKEKGFDTRIRSVGGWSTLGWTKDPILSNMLNRSTGAIAELIIHELTHATLFVEDDITFNENLATFIGEIGARKYLADRFGENSSAFIEYKQSEEDSKTFINQMLIGSANLDSVYSEIAHLPDSIKEKVKLKTIINISESLDTLHFHQNRYYKLFEKSLPNNAYFMSFLRYHSSEDSLEAIFTDNYNSDIYRFVRGMVDYHEK